MPTSPNFNIDYPCLGPSIALSDFSELAFDTEAAIAAVDAEAAAALSKPAARGLGFTPAALGVDTTLTYSAFPAQAYSSGITLNAAAGTFTIIKPGIYLASAAVQGNQSTLTMTSQRISVVVNGVTNSVRKYRGTNPITVGAITGTYSAVIGPLAAGDVVTFRYLWTGTGALTSDASGLVSLHYLAT